MKGHKDKSGKFHPHKYSNKQLRAMMAKKYNISDDDVRNHNGVERATFKTKAKAMAYAKGNLHHYSVRPYNYPEDDKKVWLVGGTTKHWSMQKYGEHTPQTDKAKKINWKKILRNQVKNE